MMQNSGGSMLPRTLLSTFSKMMSSDALRCKWAMVICLLVMSLAVAPIAEAQQLAKRSDPMTDPQVDKRVADLLSQMTLEEKIGQLNQLFYLSFIPDNVKPEEHIRQGEIGSYLFVTDPALINRFQRVAVEESRLHIPLLFGFDVIHGFRTIFPVPLALASSWDTSLIEQVHTIAAREASVVGIRWTFAPMVDITRDPRWGRIVEGAGEDPFLSAKIARAQVRGFQGPHLGSPEHLLACAKHFAGYGAADGGRDYDASFIPEVSLWNTYLPPFHAAVQAGVGSIMTAYMDLNDVPATGNRFLLQDVLRRDWGFSGFVVSDAFSIQGLTIHGFARDPQDAAFRALTAGVNMDMGSRAYAQHLAQFVKQGKITASAIDNTVRPVLAAKIRLGLFEHPFVDESRVQQILNAPEHRQLARIAAQRSCVLLRNENQLLPLNKEKVSSIAVIGPLADAPQDILGSWSVAGDAKEAVSVLQGIRNKAPSSVRVEYARGGEIRRKYPSMFDAFSPSGPKTPPLTEAQINDEIDQAVELARRSDVAVLVLGELQNMSGELASKTSLDLPGKQQQLLEAVVAAGKPVVLVLMSGRPLNISWASQHVPAILEAWHPGTEGGNAIADLLFGDANPGGKLPVTWPRHEGQIPIFYAHNLTHQPETSPGFTSRYWDMESSPLYPFGFGLSYTKFSFSNLQLKQNQIKIGATLEASVEVANTGTRAGEVVVQLYIHQRAGSASRPVRELKGFQRITLAPAEKRTVSFVLGKDELSYWSAAEKKWVMEPETFDLWIGEDATAALHTTFKVIQS